MNSKVSFPTKVLKFLRKNIQGIIITFFLLSVVTFFIYALGYATEYWIAQNSGRQITQVVIFLELQPSLTERHSTDYHNFFVPMQNANRYLLISASILLVLITISNMIGNKRRIKYYITNYIFGFLTVALAIALSFGGIAKINEVDRLWENVTYDIILDEDGNPRYSDIYYKHLPAGDEFGEHVGEYQLGFKRMTTSSFAFVSGTDKGTGEYIYFTSIDNPTSTTLVVPAPSIHQGTYIICSNVNGQVLPRWLGSTDGDSFMSQTDDNDNLVYAPQRIVITEIVDDFLDSYGNTVQARVTTKYSTILDIDDKFVPSDTALNYGYGIFSFVIAASIAYAGLLAYKAVKQGLTYKKKDEVTINE